MKKLVVAGADGSIGGQESHGTQGVRTSELNLRIPKRERLLSRTPFLNLLAIFVICPLISLSMVYAASGGSIDGLVRDAQTGDPLPGANIMIVKTSMGASTTVEGKYIIRDVPAGSYTLRATYVGYRDARVTVELKEGQPLRQDFKLISVGVEGEEVVVTAQAAGQKEAINQQLASMPISNVVSRARIQELPDVNAAESVSRLPGVSLIRTGGEGSKVVIRGLSPQYNQITIDGVEQPSNVNSANNLTILQEPGPLDVLGDRGMDLSMISSSSLGGIEVIKAITPDMDASVIGGVVNFDMRKAMREYNTGEADPTWVPKIELVAQSGYNGLKKSYNDYKFVGSAENRFADQTFGVFAQASAERRTLSSHDVTADFGLFDKSHGDEGIPELNSARLVDVRRRRERVGGTLVLDFQHETGSIGLMNTLSRSSTAMTQSDENLTWRTRDIRFNVEESNVTLGVLSNILSVKQDIGSFHVDLKASHNYSENNNPGSLKMNFWQRDNSGFQNRGSLASLTPQALAALATPRLNEAYFSDLYLSDEFTEERTLNGSLDLEMTIPISSDLTGRLKFGGAYLYRTRSYDLQTNGGVEYFRGGPAIQYILARHPSWESTLLPGTVGMAVFLTDEYRAGNFLKDEFPYPLTFTTEPVRSYLGVLSQLNPESGSPNNKLANYFNDYSGNETKSAGYAMFTLNIGERIRILPGIRYQNLTTSYEAWRGLLLPGNQVQGNDTTVTIAHGYWLPMLHVRYQPFDWCQIHFAYTNTLNYPDYSTVTPRYMVQASVVIYNNWRIKPARSENLDLVLAFHSNEIGLLTVDGFKKRISDLIFYSRTYVTNMTMYPDLIPLSGSLFEFNSYINNPRPVDVWGIEAEWQTNFWYLPKPFDGLVLNFNYTHIFSEASYPRSIVNTSYDEDGNMTQSITDTSYTTRLLNQPNDIVNLSVGYDYKGFAARVSMLYQDDIFKKPDFWMQNRQNSAKFTRWDLSLKQDLPWAGIQVYLFLNNLTGEKEVDVNQRTLYPTRLQYYGMSADLGLRVKI
jgi:TonB-dependent receptor